MRTEYREEPCRTALNRVKGMGFGWSLNPYMGCAHRCAFCYVRGFERRADRPSDERYGTNIRVKTNIVEVLSRATHAWSNVLNLRPGTREHFLGVLQGEWPSELERYQRLYPAGGSGYLRHADADPIERRLRAVRRGSGIGDRRRIVLARDPEASQLGCRCEPAQRGASASRIGRRNAARSARARGSRTP